MSSVARCLLVRGAGRELAGPAPLVCLLRSLARLCGERGGAGGREGREGGPGGGREGGSLILQGRSVG